MGRPIRVGVQVQPEHADYAQIRRAVAAVEEVGADVVLNWDHFFPLSGDPDGKHFESWTMLGAWAEATERIELGTLVSSAGYRNPDLLADMVRTVDHISGGRVILGIGAGWAERDYVEYGYEFGTAGSRIDRLASAMTRIRSRWAALNPPPLRHVPVLIGGGGEKKTLRVVAEHATIWHSFGDSATLRHKSAVLDAHCAAIGRDPAEIERSVGVGTDGRPETGDGLVAAGATLVTVDLAGPRYDLGLLREWIAWRDSVRVEAARREGAGAASHGAGPDGVARGAAAR